MKTYTFTTSKKSNNIPSSTNYSEILDNIIFTDVIKKNDYLFTYNEPIKTQYTDSFVDAIVDDIFDKNIITFNLKDNDFIKASSFLANLNKHYSPFEFGKIYKLTDGTPIIFYDNEIQIGCDCFSYSDFADINFLNAIKPKTKKTIIDIYAKGMKISIKL